MNELGTPKEVKEAADNARKFIGKLELKQNNLRWEISPEDLENPTEDIERGMVQICKANENGTYGERVTAYNIMVSPCPYKFEEDNYWGEWENHEKNLQKVLDNFKKKEFENKCDTIQDSFKNKTMNYHSHAVTLSSYENGTLSNFIEKEIEKKRVFSKKSPKKIAGEAEVFNLSYSFLFYPVLIRGRIY